MEKDTEKSSRKDAKMRRTLRKRRKEEEEGEGYGEEFTQRR